MLKHKLQYVKWVTQISQWPKNPDWFSSKLCQIITQNCTTQHNLLICTKNVISKTESTGSTDYTQVMTRKRILCLFDVDGTLTKPRNNIEPHLEEFLYNKVKPICTLGLVGGSDLKKICEQMNGYSVVDKFDYVFAENGLVNYKNGVEMGRANIQQFMGEEKIQQFINFCLGYLSKIILPIKRGTFIEFRSGMLNVCPIGRSCSQSERDDFEKYDKIHHIRKNMIEAIKVEFPNIGLTYSIGGQISFDVFPHGWDKTYCLQHLENEGFEEIHFFGDKTDKGGNDYEIFHDKRTIGHKVMNPDDTKMQLIELLTI